MPAPQLPAAGSLQPDAGNNDEVTARLEAMLAVERQLPGGAASTTLTLDSNTGGRAVATGARHRVDTAGGAASGTMAKLGVDNLDLGRRVKLSVASSLRPVTLLHAGGGTEQFFLANAVPMVLASDTATIELERLSDGWHEVDRWWGTQSGYFRDWLGLGNAAPFDLASQAEAEAGTLDTRAMSPLKTRQSLVAPGWMSSLPVATAVNPANALLLYDGTRLWRAAASLVLGQAPGRYFTLLDDPVHGSSAEFAHGLGGLPRLYTASLLCTSPDLGYPAGQETQTSDVSAYVSPTIIGWNTASPIAVSDGSGSYPTITLAKWKIVLRCWS